MRIYAPAKLNLFLHVGEKRADGFHELESLVTFTEVADILSIEPAGELSLKITGPFAPSLGTSSDNLVLRAARALDPKRGAKMTLEKHLPVAAGIGGGSADAAAALRGLNAHWGLGLSETELARIGEGIGSDVPACVWSRTLWMSGRGEILQRLPSLPSLPLVLVNPRVALGTGLVFSGLNTRTGMGAMERPQQSLVSIWDLIDYLRDASNDLEASACTIAPVIDNVLEAIAHEPGCVLAQMSGSGATCFGIFQEGPWVSGAAERLAADHPEWWVRETRIAAASFGAPVAD